MANRFGIEWNSTAEVKQMEKAKIDQMSAKAAQQRNPVAMEQAARARTIQQVFGSPATNKARKETAIMDEVVKMEKRDEETEFDYQIRQTEKIRSLAAKDSPELALKANDKLLQLSVGEVEQRKLVATTRQQERNAQNMDDLAKFGKQAWAYKRGPNGEITPIQLIDENGKTPEAIAEFEEMQKEDPSLILGSGLELLDIEDALSTASSGKLTGVMAKLFSDVKNAGAFAREIDDLTNSLAEDVGALGMGRGAVSNLGALATTVERFTDDYMARLKEEDRDEFGRDAESKIDNGISKFNSEIAEFLSANGMSNKTAEMEAMIKGMAYKLAKALDPGGRLSDQDVEMAIAMLTGNGSPEVIRKLLTQRLNRTFDNVESSIAMAEAGAFLGDIGRDEAKRARAAKDGAQIGLERLAAGITAAQKEGILGIKNGVPISANPEAPSSTPGAQLEFSVKAKQ